MGWLIILLQFVQKSLWCLFKLRMDTSSPLYLKLNLKCFPIFVPCHFEIGYIDWCVFYSLPNRWPLVSVAYFMLFILYVLAETHRNMFYTQRVILYNCILTKMKWLFYHSILFFRPSVRPSVRLSVCPSVTPFWLCSHYRIIMKFSGDITRDQGKVHAKGQGQRSKVKVTEVTTQFNRFRTVIHIWWWNDTYSLMLLRRGALLFLKVIRQISRSHGAKNRQIWPRLGVSGL